MKESIDRSARELTTASRVAASGFIDRCIVLQRSAAGGLALAGSTGSPGSANPVKTVGSFRPCVLAMNGIVAASRILDAGSLPGARMHNGDGFIDRSGVR